MVYPAGSILKFKIFYEQSSQIFFIGKLNLITTKQYHVFLQSSRTIREAEEEALDLVVHERQSLNDLTEDQVANLIQAKLAELADPGSKNRLQNFKFF